MDIENIVKSNIKRKGDLYQVTLPNIEGYYEGVFYSHAGVTMDYLSSSFSERLSFKGVDSNMHHIFLMSMICDSIFLRIIDTLDFYHDHILIIHSGEFSTFVIREQLYFVLLYEGTSGEIGYYTNFEDGSIFQASYDNHEFYINNTLTGMSIYNFSYYPSEIRIENTQNDDTNIPEIHRCIIMEDRLFPEKYELKKVKKFILSQKGNSSITLEKTTYTENSLMLNYSQPRDGARSDGEKLIGFLGTHQCILEKIGNLHEYISLDEVTDLDITMPNSFMPSGIIDSLDPGWHKLRKTLMELEYMTSVIQVHIGALRGSIDSIDALGSPFLNLQKDHSTMALIDLEKIEKIYTLHLTTLVALLINSLP